MKKIILAATAVAAVAAPVALSVAPANAATRNAPCMSRAEFRHIHIGQSVTTVQHIVGSKGRVSLASSFLTIRQWDTCSNQFGVATIGFTHKHVQSKSFFA